jgi:hypothetical protein
LKASKANSSAEDATGKEEKPWLENLNDEDFGRYKM